MSKYRIGIIAEGPTDISIIQSIVKSIFPDKVFVFVPISPTPEELSLQKKQEGFGWGGVFRVCRNLTNKIQIAEAIAGRFDCIIVHIDADVAYASYDDIREVNPIDNLPCATSNDAYDVTCVNLEKVLLGWLESHEDIIVPCIPYICMETWVGCWLYPEQWANIKEETEEKIVYELLYKLGSVKTQKEKRLLRNKAGQMKKCPKGYNKAAALLSKKLWDAVAERYTQAHKFDDELRKRM